MLAQLNYKVYGEGFPLVIIHGLFGMLDNWQSFARSIKDDFRVIAIDLRDHGKSEHTDNFTFDLAAEDIFELLTALEISSCHILGHSLGGKVAMRLTQLHPYLIKKLIVLDIGVKEYPGGHETILDSILSVDIDQVTTRQEVAGHLSKNIPNEGVRLFLMKNLKRKPEGGFTWKANFKLLHQCYQQIKSAIPDELCLTESLFINGSNSDYILDVDQEQILDIFSNAAFTTIQDAGHWVHAEQPEELKNSVLDFLS